MPSTLDELVAEYYSIRRACALGLPVAQVATLDRLERTNNEDTYGPPMLVEIVEGAIFVDFTASDGARYYGVRVTESGRLEHGPGGCGGQS